MAAKKIRDIVAKTGEYLDPSGNRKSRYVNAGSLMYNEAEGSYFIIMSRCFNPAGVPPSDKGNADTILLSCFNPDRNNNSGGNNAGGLSSASSSSGYSGTYSDKSGGDYATASGGSYLSQATHTSYQRPIDDDIPF